MEDKYTSSVTLDENQIIRVQYGFQRRITLNIVKSVAEKANELVSTPHPFIISGPNIIYLDYDAAKFCCNENLSELISAAAIITRTRLEQTLGRMFLRVHKPNYPLRLFTSEQAAEKWVLKNFSAQTNYSTKPIFI